MYLFKLGAALVCGLMAGIIALLSGLSSGARSSTVSSRTFFAFLIAGLSVLLLTFLTERLWPAVAKAEAAEKADEEAAKSARKQAERPSSPDKEAPTEGQSQPSTGGESEEGNQNPPATTATEAKEAPASFAPLEAGVPHLSAPKE